jgi:SAM-dependent methyltransferase
VATSAEHRGAVPERPVALRWEGAAAVHRPGRRAWHLAARAASIVGTIGAYALARRPDGIKNGARAFGSLAREVASSLRGGSAARSCPICGWTGPRFAPAYYFDRYQDDIRCYGCGSTDRCRMLAVWIERQLGGFFAARRRRVLDIGPMAYSRAFFPSDAAYVSFDLRPGAAMVQGDLCAAPFGDASFDVWLCFHVLDLIPDDAAAMRELFRVLAPGGVGLLDHAMNWSGPTEEYGAARRDDNDHIRRYGVDLPDRLRALGFEVEVVDTTHVFDEPTRRLHGIQPRRFLVCRRPDEAGAKQ